jgi:hypothetical protein
MELRSRNVFRQKKPEMSQFKIKIKLICFLDIRGIFQFELVPIGTTVNPTFHIEVVVERLTDAMRHKQG